MTSQPVLSDAEWDLIRQLLEQELETLPTEIHHTHSREMHSQLLDRRRMVEQLLERLHAVEAR